MTACGLNRLYYPVTSLGDGRRLGVWFQGCKKRCPDCMSPEMQPFTSDTVAMEDVLARIPGDIAPDGMTVSGGEPFDQPTALRLLVAWFLDHHTDDILVYTGYAIEELRARSDRDTDWVLSHIAALADGAYDKEQNTGVGLMGSANQRLHVFRRHERYLDFSSRPRRMQCVDEQGQLFLIGVAPLQKESLHADPSSCPADPDSH